MQTDARHHEPPADIAALLRQLGLQQVTVFRESWVVTGGTETLAIRVYDNRDRSKGDPRDAHLPPCIACVFHLMALPDGKDHDGVSRQAWPVGLDEAERPAGNAVGQPQCRDLDELRDRLENLLAPLSHKLGQCPDAAAIRAELIRLRARL